MNTLPEEMNLKKRTKTPCDYQKLLDHSLDVICSIDEHGRFIHLSAATKNVFGYMPEELEGKLYIDYVLSEDVEITIAAAANIMSGVTMTNFENRSIKKDGTIVPILWSARWDKEQRIIYCVAKNATEKKEAENKLYYQERKLRRAYKLAGIAWWEYDYASQVYTSSDEIFEMYGLPIPPHNQTTLQEFLTYVHPDDVERLFNDITSACNDTYVNYEHRIIKPTGEVIYVLHYSEVIRDKNGNVISIHGTTQNITESKLQQLQIEESQLRLVEILENLGDGFFTLDKNFVVTYWNKKAEEILGKKRNEVLNKSLWSVFPQALTLKFYTQYSHAIDHNVAVHFEEFLPILNIWFEVSAYPSVNGLSVYFKNINEKRFKEEQLKISNERYEYVTKAINEAIWDWDIASNKIYWGEGFQTIFGYDLEKNKSYNLRTWANHVHPDDLKRVKNKLKHFVASNGKHWADEYRYLKADGSYAFVSDKGFLIRDQNGVPKRMVGALRNITQEKETEITIKLSEEHYRLLFHQSPEPKWTFDAQTLQLLEVNNAALELYGYTKEAFLQLKFWDLLSKEDNKKVQHLNFEKLNFFRNVLWHKKKNGELFCVDLHAQAIDLPAGRHFIVMAEDMTEKMELEQMIIDEKVSAQKEVAKAIIETQEKERSEIGKELHDNVNQVLATTKLYIENIRCFETQKDEFIDKSIELIQKAINEIRYLSKQLVTPVINDIGFKATIEELVSHYLSLNLFKIDLKIKINEDQIEKSKQLTIYRVIQEQLHNIVKYAKPNIVKVVISQQKKCIKIIVKDDGVGFDVLKASNGLGLKNIKNRTEVHKGEIEIQSSPGNGCKIEIELPVQF